MRNIVSILALISIMLVSGCVIISETEPSQPSPDPIVGTWNLISSNGTLFFGDMVTFQWAPSTLTVNNDGTYTDSSLGKGMWRWVSENSYEFYSDPTNYRPNATALLYNDELVLTRSQYIVVQVTGTYKK